MKHFIWLTMILTAMFMLGGGCSEKSTNSDDLIEGNPDDLTYLQAKQSSQDIIEDVLGGVDEGIDYLDYEGAGPLMKPADTLFIMMYEDYWYEYRFELLSAGGHWAQSDSFRFESGVDQYQQFPDSSTIAFEFRNKLLLEFTEADTSSTVFNNAAYRFTGINSNEITINGTTDAGVEIAIGSSEATLDSDSELDDIVYLAEGLEYGYENYPISGTMVVSVGVHSDEQMGEVPAMNYEWTLTVTFNENGYHARLEAGDFYWEWDETWGPV
ncbi:MAG: hypothetical protein GY839_16170 [candidate division Zixibacteria bacterium]|nr:hypothetical protein [candidate division Zixibacteria bacterium]